MVVSNTLGLNDMMTPTLNRIVRTMNMMISHMMKVDSISKIIGADSFATMRQEVREAEIELKKMDEYLTSMHHAANRVDGGFNRWAITLTGVFAVLNIIKMGISKIGQITGMTDEYVGINARINNINDGLQTQHQLQDKIMKSANATRTSYLATADLVSKIGMTGTMKTNDEAISFAEKINKMLKIGGGTTGQQEASLMQLSQALASGVLQGDEFRSLRENAPAMMSNLAKGLGVSQGKLREMATEGKLTAEVIIQAFDKMGTEIDVQFAMMPRTFGENAVIIKNVMGSWMAKLAETGNAFGMFNQKFTELAMWLSSESGSAFLDRVTMSLNFIVSLLFLVTDSIRGLISFVDSFGGVWEGVFTGVIVAGLMIVIPLLWGKVTALWAMIPPLALQAAMWMAGHAPILWTAAAIGIVVGALIHFGITGRDVVAMVGGLVGGLVAFIVNLGILLYNHIGNFATFLYNIFVDPVFAIEQLFFNTIQNIMGFFEGLLNGIIDGLNWIIEKANAVGANVQTLGHKNFSNPLDKPSPHNTKAKVFENKDFVKYSDFAGRGADMATGFLDKFKGSSIDKAMKGLGWSGVGAGSDLGDIGKVGKVGKIENDVNIADEDIKMLMEMVVQNRVNQINLTVETAAPSIVNHNQISKEVDAEELLDYMGDILKEGAAISVKEHHS